MQTSNAVQVFLEEIYEIIMRLTPIECKQQICQISGFGNW